jgi:formylglycine-generating enzyme required for sulfatase activity
MAGNLFEWCWDWHGPAYTTGSDPHGPATGSYRVMRGGDWIYHADYARCANRGYYTPNVATGSDGFRCVRGL